MQPLKYIFGKKDLPEGPQVAAEGTNFATVTNKWVPSARKVWQEGEEGQTYVISDVLRLIKHRASLFPAVLRLSLALSS